MKRTLALPLLAVSLAIVAAPALAADKNGVSPNVISLPSGPGSIEGLGESFQPMLNTGSARYAVRIPLPKLHNTPDLKLQYDSGFGDGPAGIGWVYGPGSIARQVDKGLPRYVEGPNGLDDDADGQLDEADEADTYVGPEGEDLVPVGGGVYRARIEGGFARYRKLAAGWEVTLRNGTRVDFGTTAASQVADASGSKVFRWLPERSTDTNGNVIEYRWASYPGSESQKYLREIRYGPGAPPWGAFYFASFTYEDKPDWRADYRSGFLVRTAKRLAKIEVGIQGTLPAQCAVGDVNGDGTQDALISRYAIAYDPAHPERSFLAKVTRYGADGVNWLPPVSFSYAVYDPPPVVAANGAVIGAENAPPSVMDNGLVEFVDLNRDGLADILETDLNGGAHSGCINLGCAGQGAGRRSRWAYCVEMVSADGLPPLLHLAQDRVHLADIDGDGLADLVHMTQGGDVEFFPNTGGVSWGRKQVLGAGDTAPAAPFTSKDVTTGDLDFDKRTDIVRSTDGGYTVWFNREAGRYSSEVHTPGALYQGNVLKFSTLGVQLADMNGDRLLDVVWVRPTRVIVAAGLGYGRFATAVEIPIPDAIFTDGANGEVARAKLVDVNGDGLADLVLERAEPRVTHCWLNRGTNAFSPRIVIAGLPEVFSAGTAVRWADVNGNGTTDLVYADTLADERVRTVDIGELLGGSAHPNLLMRIDNGLGVATTIEWRSSTAFMVGDREAGRTWASTIPFPVQVVAAVVTATGMDLDVVPGPDVLRREFAYRDGFYEDRERAFRGFAEVRVTEPGDAAAPTRVSVSGFFTGGPDGVDNDGDGLIDEVVAAPWPHREEEALKGLVRFAESRSATDVLYLREENNWRVRTLLVGTEGSEVRLTYRAHSDALHYEGSATPATVRTEWAYDDFGNPTEERRYGALSIGGDEAFTFTEYVNDTTRWLIGLPRSRRVTDGAGAIVAQTLSYYDGPDFVGLPFGQAEKGNLTRTLGRVRLGEYVALVRNVRDAWGNVVGSLDPNGGLRTMEWDALLHAFPVRERIEVGGGNPELAIVVEYNLGLVVIAASTDFNGNRTEFSYDSFGRLSAIIRPGDSTAFPTLAYRYHLADPAAAVSYDYDSLGALTLTRGAASASAVKTMAREVSGQAGTFDTVAYVDGLGRSLASMAEAESGFVVRGALRFDTRGFVQKAFLPYAAPSADYAPPDPVRSGVEYGYDPLGRVVLQVIPPDAQAVVTDRRTAYLPLAATVTDERGKSRTSVADGLGRLTEVHELLGAQTLLTRYGYDPLGNLLRVTDAQQNVTSYAYDGLGRTTLLEDPDRGRVAFVRDAAGNLVRRTDNRGQTMLLEYDGANRLLVERHVLPSGPVDAARYHYDLPSPDYPAARDLRGRLAWVEDASGASFYSYDARGNVPWSVRRIRDGVFSQDYRSGLEHDAMGRVTAGTFPDGDRVSYVYDAGALLDSVPGVVSAIDYRPSGSVSGITYGNGVSTSYAYDPRERLMGLVTTPPSGAPLQRLAYTLDGAGNITAIVDGRDGVSGTAGDATQSFQYDDLNRLVRAEGPGYGAVDYRYDGVGNLTFIRSPDAPDPQHIADTLVNLGTLEYGGSAGASGRGLRRPGDPPGPHAVAETQSGLAYGYDDNGNVTSRDGDLYSWDFNDRLVRAVKGGVEGRYVYDSAGQRVIRKVIAGGEEKTTYYIAPDYEIREGRPVKYVFAGGRRLAEVEGRLAPGAESGRQEVRFEAGWNFFALEVEPAEPAVAAVLAPVAGKYAGIWAFDAVAQSYVVTAELHAQRGYLIRMIEAASLAVTGARATAAVSLAPGWNLVPSPADSPLPPDEAFAAAASQIEAAWGYESPGGAWQVWAPSQPAGVNPLVEMRPGAAYWVKATASASLPFQAVPTRTTWYHPDHLGSGSLTSDAGGVQAQRLEFYPYGRVRLRQGSPGRPRYGFTGKEEDEETGLTYFGARYYDSVVGRFASVDPLVTSLAEGSPVSGPEEAYTYVRGNPVALVDAQGLEATGIPDILSPERAAWEERERERVREEYQRVGLIQEKSWWQKFRAEAPGKFVQWYGRERESYPQVAGALERTGNWALEKIAGGDAAEAGVWLLELGAEKVAEKLEEEYALDPQSVPLVRKPYEAYKTVTELGETVLEVREKLMESNPESGLEVIGIIAAKAAERNPVTGLMAEDIRKGSREFRENMPRILGRRALHKYAREQ